MGGSVRGVGSPDMRKTTPDSETKNVCRGVQLALLAVVPPAPLDVAQACTASPAAYLQRGGQLSV